MEEVLKELIEELQKQYPGKDVVLQATLMIIPHTGHIDGMTCPNPTTEMSYRHVNPDCDN